MLEKSNFSLRKYVKHNKLHYYQINREKTPFFILNIQSNKLGIILETHLKKYEDLKLYRCSTSWFHQQFFISDQTFPFKGCFKV